MQMIARSTARLFVRLAAMLLAGCLLAGFTGCSSDVKEAASSSPAAQTGSTTSGTAETTVGAPSDSSHTEGSSSAPTDDTQTTSATGPTGNRTNATNSTSKPVASQTKTGSIGTLLMNQPSHGSMAASDKPTFTWLEASNAESYTFRLELYDQKTGKYTTAIEKAGITGSSYTPAIALQKNAVYRWSLTAINSADSVKGQGINGTERNVLDRKSVV